MLVGVLSDTHDNLNRIDQALALFSEQRVEALIHPGDFVAPFAMRRITAFPAPLHATIGNNDGERKGLTDIFADLADGPLHVTLGGRRVLVHHYLGWCKQDDIDRAEIIVTGHTHEVDNRLESGKLFLNPGECCGWVSGRSTVALLDTDKLSARIIDLEKS